MFYAKIKKVFLSDDNQQWNKLLWETLKSLVLEILKAEVDKAPENLSDLEMRASLKFVAGLVVIWLDNEMIPYVPSKLNYYKIFNINKARRLQCESFWEGSIICFPNAVI